jgi:hypothetical protein
MARLTTLQEWIISAFERMYARTAGSRNWLFSRFWPRVSRIVIVSFARGSSVLLSHGENATSLKACNAALDTLMAYLSQAFMVKSCLGYAKHRRGLILLLGALLSLGFPAAMNARDLDMYVNSAPEGLGGIVYNGYFFRHPAAGEHPGPSQCALKLNGFCFLDTGYRVNRISQEVVAIKDLDSKRPVYLCRSSYYNPFTRGECSPSGWIAHPEWLGAKSIGIDADVIECMCKQKVGRLGEKAITQCKGHYLSEYYYEQCGKDVRCLEGKMNNGFGSLVDTQLCF